MATKIHPTAIVAKEAQISDGVEIGPYCLIGPHVKIGSGTRLYGHAVVEGHTQIGQRCQIYYGASLGMPPQDTKYKGDVSYLVIGDDNIIREQATLSLGSKPQAKTLVGNSNFLMTACHVGHDCVIGDGVTLVNGVALAGYVTIEDKVIVGGLSGVHQFCRIGKMAIVGGLSKVVMDIPPFSMANGIPATIKGINAVGLRRAGFNSSQLVKLKNAIKILFMSGNGLTNALEKLLKEVETDESLNYLIEFIKKSKRGIARNMAVTDEAEADVV
jgi:UDP-N-acetylglucosamine acyltransferase